MTKFIPSYFFFFFFFLLTLHCWILPYCIAFQSVITRDNHHHRHRHRRVVHHGYDYGRIIPTTTFRTGGITTTTTATTTILGVTDKPLYDGTNYTFPDTTTVDGIAEVLEVSFVHSCMQLASGYVDILKMFIATAMASYEFGFAIDDVQSALEDCPNLTANRPLMEEESDLRYKWLCLVYLMLMNMGHPSRRNLSIETIPNDIQTDYGNIIDKVIKAGEGDDVNRQQLSMEQLLAADDEEEQIKSMSDVEKAIRSQSIRVIQLTPTVIVEALEARPGGGGGASPPKPPIKGAFE